jgi:hypothetical protein
MIEEQLPIQIVTLFHPERYLSIPASDLASVPAVNRVRESVEAKRREAARALHVPFVTETFHDRQIINLGTPVEELRNRHVKSIDLLACLRDFDARMIDTSETGSQARYKIEFRPNWADVPDPLPPIILNGLLAGVEAAKLIWIRQVWRNPDNARFGTLPLEVPADIAPETANLVVGPFDKKHDKGAAGLRFAKFGNVWWLSYNGKGRGDAGGRWDGKPGQTRNGR